MRPNGPPAGRPRRDAAQSWLRRVLARTPLRTFVVYPLVVGASETVRRKRFGSAAPGYLPLLVWGYLQFRLTGEYRRHQRAGAPGFDEAPDRLLESGPYAYTRNP